jgi:hypothetical protein
MAHLFSSYASFRIECTRRRLNVTTGLDTDELKELSNELWTLHDTFAEGDGEEWGSDGVDLYVKMRNKLYQENFRQKACSKIDFVISDL